MIVQDLIEKLQTAPQFAEVVVTADYTVTIENQQILEVEPHSLNSGDFKVPVVIMIGMGVCEYHGD